MNSLVEKKGIGSALVEAVKEKAKAAGCERLWLITTNDNAAALRFWQKRGFRLSAIYPNAVEELRRLKPEIPLTGNDGIPIRDEMELEMIF
jgi:ribosomal protein S18 acetylase RimI-like enzyme